MGKKEKLLILKYYLTDYLFEVINDNKRIKDYFKEYFIFSTFEIDSYKKKDDYEYVQFDLAAQNTGNVFKYKYNIKTNEYKEIEKPSLFYSRVDNLEIPNEILKEIFYVARENRYLIDLEKKLIKKLIIYKIYHRVYFFLFF